MVGCRLGPEEAYRFARGEEVISSTGVRARLQRPLDFLVVSDHAENLGLAPMIAESNPDLLKTEFGRKLHDLVKSGKGGDAYNFWGECMIKRHDPLKGNDAITRSMWERITTAAEKYNEPGKFTAFIGFEWTSMPGRQQPPSQRHLPRRQGQGRSDHPILAIRQGGPRRPVEVDELPTSRRPVGGCSPFRTTAISRCGMMFDDVTLTTKKPLDRDYAATPDALGAALRSHANEGRRRSAPSALAQRRVRRISRPGTTAASGPAVTHLTCCRASMPARH